MARLDIADMHRLNAQLLHETAYADVALRLAAMGLGNITEPLWNMLRANLNTLEDLRPWKDILGGDITPIVSADDREFVTAAKDALPTGDITPETWSAWTNALKEKTGRKGKGLFMPLRLALTGMEHGPEMAPLLPLIGRDKILKRLAS